MIEVVWKYSIPIQDEFELEMPMGSKILAVQNQVEEGCIWALCSPNAPKESRLFLLRGTGQLIEAWADTLAYHGTFQLAGGALVFHLFEVRK